MNKKITIAIITLIAVIGIITGVVMNNNQKFEQKLSKSEVSITRKDALLGTIINVDITELGKEKYPTAAKYTTFDKKGEATSPMARLSADTTALDSIKSRDTLIVKLYDKDNKEVVQIEGIVK